MARLLILRLAAASLYCLVAALLGAASKAAFADGDGAVSAPPPPAYVRLASG